MIQTFRALPVRSPSFTITAAAIANPTYPTSVANEIVRDFEWILNDGP